jgi:anti-anti-sigma factor
MSDKSFSIEEEKVSATSSRFTLEGRINAVSATAFEHKLKLALETGHINIIVDMSEVEFLSSAGIRVLLATYKNAKSQGGALWIDSPSENVRNVLGMTALDEMLLKEE